MKRLLVLAIIGAAGISTAVLVSQQLPLKQVPEVLTAGPARIDKVKDGLYVVRGPFVPCTTRGCRPCSQYSLQADRDTNHWSQYGSQ